MATRLTELLKEAMAKGQTEEGQPALGEGSQGGWTQRPAMTAQELES